MKHNKRPMIGPSNTLRRGGLVASVTLAVMIGLSWAATKTGAEFEVPLIDTTAFLPTDFRSVWGFYRAERLNVPANQPDNSGGKIIEMHQAYAVGQTDYGGAPAGAVYQLRNEKWEQIAPNPAAFPSAGLATGRLNAVVGQYDPSSGYATLWVGGKDESTNRALIAFADNVDPGDSLDINHDFANFNNQSPVCIVTVAAPTTCSNQPDVSEIYSLAAVQRFGGEVLAGGSKRLLLRHLSPSASTNPPNADRWQIISRDTSSGTTGLTASPNEDVVGIAFSSPRVAYIVTTTFSLDVNHEPYDRVCNPNQTSRLYRVINDPNVAANWTRLHTTGFGVCYYGLTVGTRNTNNLATNSPAYNTIWVASSQGVERFDDDFGASAAPTVINVGQAMYGITAIPEKSGSTSLVLNGNFEAWETPSSTADNNNPENWIAVEQNNIGRNNSGGTCGSNTRDVWISGSAGARAVRVNPGLYHPSLANCSASPPVNPQRNAQAYVVQQVDLTSLEGSAFKIRGRYQVTFNADNAAVFPQGGVLVSCAGTNPPNSVDCPYSNFSHIRVKAQGNTSGFVNFEMVMSRQDSSLISPILGGVASPQVAGSGHVLELRCYATYGADVTCDDLVVEPYDIPAISAKNSYTVIAVGAQGYGYINRDAITSNVFVPEIRGSASTAALTAIHARSLQHMTIVGDGSRLLQRIPGNLTGYIWAGTASPGNTGLTALGWISTNCANHRNASGVSLCQRARESFGTSLENIGVGADNYVMLGRAWLGKQYASGKPNDDQETINLGSCQNAARPANFASSNATYQMNFGTCSGGRCTGDNSVLCSSNLECQACNTSTRTCRANPNKACLRDFDCYGRCSGDQSFICLYATGDCNRGVTATPSPAPSISGSRLSRLPADALRCSGGSASAQNACTAGGWLTFNPGDFQGSPPSNDGCTGNGACFDTANGKLRGWAQFMTVADSDDPNVSTNRGGWVRLRGANTNPITVPVNGQGKLIGCQQCSIISGSSSCQFCQDAQNQSCTPSSSVSCQNYCGGDLTKPCILESQCAAGVACEPVGFCSGNPNLQCTNDDFCRNASAGHCNIGATCNAGGIGSCQQYGINLSTRTGQFYGYAWSPDYGWLDFRGTTKGRRRFIQTKLGDVYSGKNIGDITTAPAPAGTCNATYVISATGTINNFCTNLVVNTTVTFNEIQSGVDIPFADERNIFENALGRIDLSGLQTPVNGGSNKYGSQVVSLVATSDPAERQLSSYFGSSTSLNKRVFRACLSSGPNTCTPQLYTMTQDLSLAGGSGLLIIDGDLRVDGNITYTNSSITDLRDLPSLMVIVRGNLYIDNSVTTLAGNYYVSGTVCTGQPDPGAFEAGDPVECDPGAGLPNVKNSSNSYPLTVRGIMLAKQFYFARIFAGTIENPLPSELIISDGRLQGNPLPGLAEFANSLPSNLNTGP